MKNMYDTFMQINYEVYEYCSRKNMQSSLGATEITLQSKWIKKKVGAYIHTLFLPNLSNKTNPILE